MPLRAVVAVEQSVIKALQRAIWTVLRMLLHAKCPSFGKPALWSTSRVLRSILAVSGWRAAQVDDNSDVLGDLIAARADRLRPGVRGKRMFLTPFYIFIFAFFGGKAVLSSFFFFPSTQLGLEVRYSLAKSFANSIGWQTTSVQHGSEGHTDCSEEKVLPLFVKVSRKTNSNRE